MNPAEYKFLDELEETHWWFVGMRHIVAAMLEKELSSGPLRILDAGCGTGFNMSWLRSGEKDWEVFGMDLSTEAIRYCRRRGEVLLTQCSIADLPFAEASFDLIVSFDVLDVFTLEDVGRPIADLARVLKPGGNMLIRVPAFQFLHSEHDQAVSAVHRYTAGELARSLRQAGLLLERVTYANTFLFPVAVLWRWLHRIPRGPARSDVKPLPKLIRWLNPAFAWLLRIEAAWLRHLSWRLPAGLSVIALARKPSVI